MQTGSATTDIPGHTAARRLGRTRSSFQQSLIQLPPGHAPSTGSSLLAQCSTRPLRPGSPVPASGRSFPAGLHLARRLFVQPEPGRRSPLHPCNSSPGASRFRQQVLKDSLRLQATLIAWRRSTVGGHDFGHDNLRPWLLPAKLYGGLHRLQIWRQLFFSTSRPSTSLPQVYCSCSQFSRAEAAAY